MSEALWALQGHAAVPSAPSVTVAAREEKVRSLVPPGCALLPPLLLLGSCWWPGDLLAPPGKKRVPSLFVQGGEASLNPTGTLYDHVLS